jgi:hypothetical protein
MSVAAQHDVVFLAVDPPGSRMFRPSFKGIIGSDRWWAYELIDAACRQACWEHHKRDFAFHAAGALTEQKQLGEAGSELTKRLFETWHALASTQIASASRAR